MSSAAALHQTAHPRPIETGADAVFIFAGGGTGGHLYPGLAIAEQLRAVAGAHAVFACSERPIDARILREEQVEFHVIPARPFGLSPRLLLRFLGSWGAAVRAGRHLIRTLRAAGAPRAGPRPVHVIAMGGFVAAPLAQAARVERAALTLVNLDAAPGRANRWIARRARLAFTASRIATPGIGAAWTLVPPIVRKAGLAPGDAAACRRMLGLDPARPTLLVTGASLGAQSINRFLLEFVRAHRDLFLVPGASTPGPWQIVHQTGESGVEETRRAYAEAGVRAVVDAFFPKMGACWGAADCAVSRAGAGSVAEAWANHIPTVFMPYPYHRDQHQRLNAMVLEQRGGALIREDFIDPRTNFERHGSILAELLRTPDRREELRRGLVQLGPADGALRVARALLAEGDRPKA